MKIGIDLDNTITANEKSFTFFSLLTNLFSQNGNNIYIITHREDTLESLIQIEEILENNNIYYDEIIITGEKKEVILRKKIEVYFDDTDEYFLELPESVLVFKIREDGNFSFTDKKWLYGKKTGKKID